MADGMIKYLASVVLIQLFFSFGITMLTYAVPSDALQFVTVYTTSTTSTDLGDIGADIEDALTQQTSIPVIELGALVFYSGNILIDLMLNFIFAVPEMITLVFNGLFLIFNLDNVIKTTMLTFIGVGATALYMLGVINLLIGIRSGQI